MPITRETIFQAADTTMAWRAQRDTLTRERDATRQDARDALAQAARAEQATQDAHARQNQAEAETAHLRAQLAAAQTQATAAALAQAERHIERLETRAEQVDQARAEAQAQAARLTALLERRS